MLNTRFIRLRRASGYSYEAYRASVLYELCLVMTLLVVYVVYGDAVRSTPAKVFWSLPGRASVGVIGVVLFAAIIPLVAIPCLAGMWRRTEAIKHRRLADWRRRKYGLLGAVCVGVVALSLMAPFIVTTVGLLYYNLTELSVGGVVLLVATVVCLELLRLAYRALSGTLEARLIDFPELMRPHKEGVLNLNVGSLASRLGVVTSGLRVWAEYVERHGASSRKVWSAAVRDPHEPAPREWLDAQRGSAWEGVEALREKVGRFVGAEGQRVIFLTNTTRAIRVALESLRPERVLLTDLEHPSQRASVAGMAARIGATVGIVPLASWAGLASDARRWVPERLADECERSGANVLLVSHVAYSSGSILPIGEIVAAIRGKGLSTRVVVDGAHAVGQTNVEVDRLGVDFYAFCGHKWLYGPAALGVLIAGRERFEEVNDRLSGEIYESVAVRLPQYGQRGATIDLNAFVGLANSLGVVEDFGAEQFAHNRSLGGSVFENEVNASRTIVLGGLSDLPRVPGIKNIQRKSGLLSGEELEDAVRALDQHRLLATSVESPPSIRLCLPYYLTERDIRRAVRTLEAVVAAA